MKPSIFEWISSSVYWNIIEGQQILNKFRIGLIGLWLNCWIFHTLYIHHFSHVRHLLGNMHKEVEVAGELVDIGIVRSGHPRLDGAGGLRSLIGRFRRLVAPRSGRQSQSGAVRVRTSPRSPQPDDEVLIPFGPQFEETHRVETRECFQVQFVHIERH